MNGLTCEYMQGAIQPCNMDSCHTASCYGPITIKNSSLLQDNMHLLHSIFVLDLNFLNTYMYICTFFQKLIMCTFMRSQIDVLGLFS